MRFRWMLPTHLGNMTIPEDLTDYQKIAIDRLVELEFEYLAEAVRDMSTVDRKAVERPARSGEHADHTQRGEEARKAMAVAEQDAKEYGVLITFMGPKTFIVHSLMCYMCLL